MQNKQHELPADAVRLVWMTPGSQALLAYMARVSNPENQDNPSIVGLIRYLIRHKHWSPFEMVGACVEINTVRDVSRQILRHRSFHFQEFSGRYASNADLPKPALREARLQDSTNRQNSLPCYDPAVAAWWAAAQRSVEKNAHDLYRSAIGRGIAKEAARALLPEGLCSTRMYMHGTLRDWLHYLAVRTGPETQKEHRAVAQKITGILRHNLPDVMQAFEEEHGELYEG